MVSEFSNGGEMVSSSERVRYTVRYDSSLNYKIPFTVLILLPLSPNFRKIKVIGSGVKRKRK